MSAPVNPPAFPVLSPLGINAEGMTLRDWFATHAPEPPPTWWGGSKSCAGYAVWAFQYADAMLAERERTQGNG